MNRLTPAALFLAALAGPARDSVAAGPDFAREVRPVISSRCFKCHGPDEERQEAGLRLDLREAALAEHDSGAISRWSIAWARPGPPGLG